MSEPISVQEIQNAIAHWPNNKSPGSDGFTGEFYKSFVDVLSQDIYATLHSVTQLHTPLYPLNSSYIILLPKKEALLSTNDFRPINLLHGIQKIFSKILADRLQGHIQDLVEEAQSGFIKNRQITEGFVYAKQVLHCTHTKKLPLGIFKADIKKAYDTISWSFLLKILKRVGFEDQ